MEPNTSAPQSPEPSKSSSMMWPIIIVLAAIIALVLWRSNNSSNQSADDTSSKGGTSVTPSPSPTPNPATSTPSMTDEVKTFTVEATPFAFSPAEIKVNKGDKVRIVFVNKNGFHDWVLDEFSAKTKQLQAGETETIQFLADKSGTFEYYCSVGNHRQMGMKGKLIVE
jgi:plastocyanin